MYLYKLDWREVFLYFIILIGINRDYYFWIGWTEIVSIFIQQILISLIVILIPFQLFVTVWLVWYRITRNHLSGTSSIDDPYIKVNIKAFTFKMADKGREKVLMGKQKKPIDQTSDLIDVVLHAILKIRNFQIWIEPMFLEWYMAMNTFLLVLILP